MKDLISSLTLSSIKHNYVEFVEEYGYELANEKLSGLFGDIWDTHKEEVWQWYDTDRKSQTEIWTAKLTVRSESNE